MILALACALIATTVATSFAAKEDQNAPSIIPATWQAFAARVKAKFQERLAGRDAAAQQFHDYLSDRFARPGTPPPSVIVRAWFGGDGQVERLEFDGVFDLDVIVNLRAILVGADIGSSPPPEMPQPLRLRLLLGYSG
jgi:hypothetical protein